MPRESLVANVIGCGKVGSCYVSTLTRSGVAVRWADKTNGFRMPPGEPRPDWSRMYPYSGDAHATFIIVDTPSKPDGTFDATQVFDVMERYSPPHVVVSTVSPGTLQGRRPSVHYAPSMIRLGNVTNDLWLAQYQILGCDDDNGPDPNVVELLRIISPNARIMPMGLHEAELAKLLVNAYLTTKISFANAVNCVCREAGLDAVKVLAAIGADYRIGADYMSPGGSYGGPCLPRDTVALRAYNPVLGGLMSHNEAVNQTVIDMTVEEALMCEPTRVKLVGNVAYKPSAPDVGPSYGRAVREKLILRGVTVVTDGDADVTVAIQPGCVGCDVDLWK